MIDQYASKPGANRSINYKYNYKSVSINQTNLAAFKTSVIAASADYRALYATFVMHSDTSMTVDFHLTKNPEIGRSIDRIDTEGKTTPPENEDQYSWIEVIGLEIDYYVDPRLRANIRSRRTQRKVDNDDLNRTLFDATGLLFP